MPQIEIAKNQIYNNATIECAHITISSADGTQVYRFRNLFEAENDYTTAVDYSWQMVARANGNKSITITVGSGTNSSHTFALTTTFTQFTHVYQGIVASEYPFVDMQLPVGEYWFYHVQLEKGNVVTDWHPHLDDGVDIAIANTTEQINNVNQTIKSWVTFYDSEFTKTDEAITAHARRITANENNLTEIRQTTEAQFQVQADRINSIVSDVETLDNKVDNNYSEIQQTATNIQAKVTAIETFVGGDTTIAESSLQQEANRISTQVSERISADTVNTALNNLEIGGENLLDGSDDFSGWSFSSNVAKLSDRDSDGSIIAQWNTVSTFAWRELRSKPQPYSLIKNRKVTASFWVRSQDYASIQALTSGGISCTIGLCTGESTTRTKYRGIVATTRSITDEWTKLDGTATITDDWFTSGSGTIDENTRFFVQVYNYTIYRLQVKKVQLEYGDYSTEWSPQPGDYRSSFEQTATSISQKLSINDFTAAEITTRLNANNDSEVYIKADKLNLNGAITANNNVTIGTDGKITAKAGYIGNGTSGFTIGNTAIYNGVTSMSDTAHNGVYVGTDGIRLGKGVFNVTNAGALTASNATITGMNGSISIKDSSNRVIFSASNSGIQANTIQNDTLTTLLSVGTSGSGTFAGWSFNKDAIYRTNATQGNANGMYFGVNGLSIKDKFKVDSQGNLIASNATLTGGSIIIKSGNDNVFYVSSSGMNVYKGSISLGNGAFYVDSDGNAYVNTIHVRSSGTGNATTKDMFYIGSRPSSVDGVTIDDNILPSSYDQKTLMCKTMLAENLVARNITITGGSVNISNNDHGADGLYSYINLGYGWTKSNRKYSRVTQMTSSGITCTLNGGIPPEVTELLDVRLYDHGLSATYDYKNVLGSAAWRRRGVYADTDKLRLYLDNTDVLSAQISASGSVMATNITIGCDESNGNVIDGYAIDDRSDTLTTIHGKLVFTAASKVFIGSQNGDTLAQWINGTVVDDSAHSFTKAITSSNSFQIKKTISSIAYNSLNVNNNVTQEVYSGKAANILFGRGNDTNPSGGVRFLDSVTLPNGNPASVSSGTGTRVYDGTTLKTLKQFVIDNAPAPSGSDNNFTNEYKNYLDMLASTSSTTGVSRINLGSADTIYVGSSKLSAYVSSAASSAASGKMASTGSSSTVTFSGTTTLSGTTYIPSATRIGTSSSYKTLSDYITWSATSTSGAPSGKYVITTKLEALFKGQTSNNTVYKVTSCQAYKLGEMVIMSIWLQRQSGYTGNTSVNIDLSANQYSPLRPLTTVVTAMGSQDGGGCGAVMFTSGYVLQFRFPTPPSTANSYYYQANLVYRSENTTALNTYYS